MQLCNPSKKFLKYHGPPKVRPDFRKEETNDHEISVIEDFKSNNIKVDMRPPRTKTTKAEEGKQNPNDKVKEGVLKARSRTIQAKIIQIMKAHKKMKWNDLVMDVRNQIT